MSSVEVVRARAVEGGFKIASELFRRCGSRYSVDWLVNATPRVYLIKRGDEYVGAALIDVVDDPPSLLDLCLVDDSAEVEEALLTLLMYLRVGVCNAPQERLPQTVREWCSGAHERAVAQLLDQLNAAGTFAPLKTRRSARKIAVARVPGKALAIVVTAPTRSSEMRGVVLVTTRRREYTMDEVLSMLGTDLSQEQVEALTNALDLARSHECGGILVKSRCTVISLVGLDRVDESPARAVLSITRGTCSENPSRTTCIEVVVSAGDRVARYAVDVRVDAQDSLTAVARAAQALANAFVTISGVLDPTDIGAARVSLELRPLARHSSNLFTSDARITAALITDSGLRTVYTVPKMDAYDAFLATGGYTFDDVFTRFFTELSRGRVPRLR